MRLTYPRRSARPFGPNELRLPGSSRRPAGTYSRCKRIRREGEVHQERLEIGSRLERFQVVVTVHCHEIVIPELYGLPEQGHRQIGLRARLGPSRGRIGSPKDGRKQSVASCPLVERWRPDLLLFDQGNGGAQSLPIT